MKFIFYPTTNFKKMSELDKEKRSNSRENFNHLHQFVISFEVYLH